MPLSKIQFKPGIDKESTTYASEGGYFDCDKVRFSSGFPEKIGGWKNQNINATFYGVARWLYNWISLNTDNLLGIGTSQRFYIQNGVGGEYHDITPVRATVTLGTNPFATVSGSKKITVTANGHGASEHTFVSFADTGPVVVGGITVADLGGVEFEIIEAIDGNSFTIAAPTAANATTSGGASAIVATYYINAGGNALISGNGWGIGVWGGGGSRGWGTPTEDTTVRIPMRLWSSTSYGEDLVLAVNEGELYYWDLDITPPLTRAVALDTKVNLQTKVTTAGTSAGAGTTITLVDSTLVDIGSVVISGTNIANPGVDYVTSVIGNVVTLSAATSGAASGNYVFSYAGRFVPHTVGYVVGSDLAHFTVALGANPYNPDNANTAFDPMLVRWCDQDNVYQWVPRLDNQAGEQRLNHGSYLVAGHITRQEMFVFSDTAVYSMQYLGPPYVFSFNLLMDNISIASPQAAVTTNNATFWMGVDNFYVYTGRVATLPCTLHRFVFGNINREQMFQIVSGTNAANDEIWWFYPSANSPINDSYVIFNYIENIWYYGTLNRSAWLDSPSRAYPMAAFSVQNSFLRLAIDATTTDLPLFLASSYPVSGTVIIGTEEITYTGVANDVLTGCTRGANGTTAQSHLLYSSVNFRTPNQILNHEYEVDDQSNAVPEPIAAHIESSDFDIGDGHNFGFVWRILPDLTFSGSTVASPQVMLTVKPRLNSGTDYSAAGQPAVTRASTVPIEQYTGEVFTRIRGRQMSFRLDSTMLGVAWQMGAMRLDIRPDGRR